MARAFQRLWRLRLPSAVPALLEGHKVAAGLAVVGAVVAEFVAGSGGAQGLAWRILEASNRLQTPRVFAALAVLAAAGRRPACADGMGGAPSAGHLARALGRD
jgi:NitT/TauT family transport system permease protein